MSDVLITVDSAMAALAEVQQQVWQLWQRAQRGTDVEACLDFANGELVNIIEDLRAHASADWTWCDDKFVPVARTSVVTP